MSQVKLLHGDCLELLTNIPDGSVDMVLCDPPYGIDFQSSRIKDKERRKPKIIGDTQTQISFIHEIGRIIKPYGAVCIFSRWDVQQKVIDEMTACGMKPRNVIIWDKVSHGMGDLKRAFAGRYESIVFYSAPEFRFNGKRPQDIVVCPRVPACKLVHPNEKPVELLEKLIRFCTSDGGLVLDCFMGCGSTGVACLNTERCFIGMELDKHYFDIAVNRIAEAQGMVTV
jgi:DNA modification methylase